MPISLNDSGLPFTVPAGYVPAARTRPVDSTGMDEHASARLWLPLGLVLLAFLVYAPLFAYGLDWDDYHFVRAYSWADVGRAFVGSWDPTGIETAYYRPLAVLWFAVRSSEPSTLHGLSVLLAATVAVLMASWLRALGCSRIASGLGAAGLLVHPLFAAGGVTWITNQPHLLMLAVVLGAGILAIDRPDRWPLVLWLQLLALLLKEDGIMLAPAIAAVWWLRGARVPRGWLVGSAVLVVAYLGVRTWALAGVTLSSPDTRSVFLKAVAAPAGVFLGGAPFGLWPLALPLLALVGLGLFSGARLGLPLAWLLIWNLPLLVSSRPNRWHLVTVAACTLFAVAGEAAFRRWPKLTAAVVAVALLEGVLLTQAIVHASAPCSPGVLAPDRDVLTWQRLSPAYRAVIQRKDCGQD